MPQGLGFRTTEQVWAEMVEVGPWDGELASSTSGPTATCPATLASTARPRLTPVSCWLVEQLLDNGRMQDGDEAMRRTARKPVLLVGAATLDSHGLAVGDLVTLSGPRGSVDLPVGLGDLAEGTVWAPATSPGLPVRILVGPRASRSRCRSSPASGPVPRMEGRHERADHPDARGNSRSSARTPSGW